MMCWTNWSATISGELEDDGEIIARIVLGV